MIRALIVAAVNAYARGARRAVDQAELVDLVPDDCAACGYPLGYCCCVVAR